MPQDEQFSLKEAIGVVATRIETIDRKQDLQLQNQADTRIALAALPAMERSLLELSSLVKDPVTGVIVRLRTVESHLEEQDRREANRSTGLFERRSQVLAAIIGAVALVALGVFIAWVKLPH